jgi:Holliday junction DNA helicase RuvA
MFEYIDGVFAGLVNDAVVIDVGGIGYRIYVGKACSSRATSIGSRLRLWVECVIREDSQTIYGFTSLQDRDFFRLLQQVSGIGPKLAMSILGHSQSVDLADAIFRRDTKLLSTLPGIGKKLAERLAIELQEKVQDSMKREQIILSPQTALAQQGIQALQTLGFSLSEARASIVAAQKSAPTAATVESLVQYALSTRR